MTLRIAPLIQSNEKDFWSLHDGSACNGCYCMAWRVPTWDEWDDCTPEANRKARCSHFEQGEYDGLLLYEDSEPIGWCQLVRVGTLPKLMQAVNIEASADYVAISCILLHPDKRGKGIGSQFISMVAAYSLANGIDKLLGLPRKSGSSNEEIWTGTDGMFHKAGFVPDSGNPRVFVLPPK